MKSDSNFFKDNRILQFYAHDISNSDGRMSLFPGNFELEGIQSETVSMFLSGEETDFISESADLLRGYEQVKTAFLQFGLEDPRFQMRKADYLTRIPVVSISVRAKDLNLNSPLWNEDSQWYCVCVHMDETAEKYDHVCIFEIPGVGEQSSEVPCEIRQASEQDERKLNALFSPYVEEAHLISPGKNKEAVWAVGPDTAIDAVQVMYVGAALCTCLTAGDSVPLGYFDMGRESLYSKYVLINRSPAYGQFLCQKEENIVGMVKHEAEVQGNPTVIISHWHEDHVKILYEMALAYSQDGHYRNFWENAVFFFPQCIQKKGWATVHATAILGAIQNAGNQNYTVIPYQNSDEYRLERQYQNLSIFSCHRNDQSVSAPNPHDHGLYAIVTLTSGKRVLLPGDCSYDTMSAQNSGDSVLKEYDYLVATHHGGKYTHTTANHKTAYIPTPRQGTACDAIFSANGVAYGHPNATVVSQYGKTWNCLRTDQLPGNYDMYILG